MDEEGFEVFWLVQSLNKPAKMAIYLGTCSGNTNGQSHKR